MMRCDMKTCRYNERGYCTNKTEREVCVEVAERVLVGRVVRNEDDGK